MLSFLFGDLNRFLTFRFGNIPNMETLKLSELNENLFQGILVLSCSQNLPSLQWLERKNCVFSFSFVLSLFYIFKVLWKIQKEILR